ncbi:MAG: acyl-CoA dehydrogenase family protein [Pararhodobacter sp.]|nr:acyl-CoA dehydrogenase family protein [Pararhodobacter sp.]
MDFQQTDTRRMLADSMARYLDRHCDYDHRRKIAYDAPFHDPAVWEALADLGVIGALLPEDKGGFGGAGFDIATVFQALGHALCPEPMLAQLMGLSVLADTGQETEAALTGQEKLALALGEPGGGSGMEPPQTRAQRAGEAWRLDGRKSVVWGGGSADRLVVSAAHDQGLGLFLVNAGDAGIAPYAMIDGGGAAEVSLDECPAICLVEEGGAVLARAIDRGTLALCAEAVGAMDHVQGLLAEHLRTRKQFGVPLSKFQVLRHRFIDLCVELEQARSITIRAADALDTPEGPRAVSMAKALVGQVARQWSEEAIQLHGGIGMTWEAAVSHYAKRLVMIDHQLGDSLWHLERVARAYSAE